MKLVQALPLLWIIFLLIPGVSHSSVFKSALSSQCEAYAMETGELCPEVDHYCDWLAKKYNEWFGENSSPFTHDSSKAEQCRSYMDTLKIGFTCRDRAVDFVKGLCDSGMPSADGGTGNTADK